MWQLFMPFLLPWLTRLLWIAAVGTVFMMKAFWLIVPLVVLWLLMKVRLRREKP